MGTEITAVMRKTSPPPEQSKDLDRLTYVEEPALSRGYEVQDAQTLFDSTSSASGRRGAPCEPKKTELKHFQGCLVLPSSNLDRYVTQD